MFKISTITSNSKPITFTDLNSGYWYYTFNITSENAVMPSMQDPDIQKETVRYTFSLVRIQGKPTVSSCYETLLENYTNDEGVSLKSALSMPIVSNDAKQLANSLYETVLIDFGLINKPTELETEKTKVLRKIEEYDTSINVNSFYLNGLQIWLDKSTRVGLMNSLNIEKNAGKETSTLWFGSIKLEINTDAAISMLSQLELYALACYNKTAEHKIAIEKLDTVKSVQQYDYTAGYPAKLNFNI